MKQQVLVGVLLFFVGLFTTLTIASAATLTSADPSTIQQSLGQASAAAMPSKVDYTLPYPGLLPDNPLYIFKVLRDNVVGFFISDSLKKAQFDLLMADVRVNAGEYLSQKGATHDKDEKISEVVSKGENYFAEALENTKKAKNEGRDVSAFAGTLVSASAKHVEVIMQIEQTANPTLKVSLATDASRVQEYGKEAEGLNK